MSPRFALDHIAAPRRDVSASFALATELGLVEVEIRNDLPGVALRDGTPAGPRGGCRGPGRLSARR